MIDASSNPFDHNPGRPGPFVYGPLLSESPRPTGPGLVRRLARYWWLFLLAGGASAAVAWEVGQRYHKEVWRPEGQMLYRPAPLPESMRALYTPPSLETYTILMKSPPILEAIREEFGLAASVQDLDRAFTVEHPRGSENFYVRIDWGDPVQAAAMVNRLMELHIADSRFRRRETTVRASLVDAYRVREERRSRLQRFDDYLAFSRTGPLGPGSAEEFGPDGSATSRRGLVQDSIDKEESHLAILKTEFGVKQKKLNQERELIARHATAQSNLDQAEAEVESHRIQIESSEDQLRKWRKELTTLPADTRAQGKRNDLVLQLKEAEEEARRLEKELEAFRAEGVHRAGSPTRTVLKPDGVTVLNSTGGGRPVQTQRLGDAPDLDVNEFEVVTPATPPAAEASSTRRTLMVTTFGIPMGLLTLGLVWLDGRRRRPEGPDATVIGPFPMPMPVVTPVRPMLALPPALPPVYADDPLLRSILTTPKYLPPQQPRDWPAFVTPVTVRSVPPPPPPPPSRLRTMLSRAFGVFVGRSRPRRPTAAELEALQRDQRLRQWINPG
jgi:hypothetical protein